MLENVPIDELDEAVRKVAREEIASLCGLVLRRLQEQHALTADALPSYALSSIFAEALRDFSGPSAPGE